MPCNKRSRPLEHAVPSKRTKKEYQVLDNIGYVEDRCHSLFRELPTQIELASKLIGRCIVSMLNTAGGIVAFGVRTTGIIYGETISRKEEDVLKCTIDEVIKRISPCVSYYQYSVRFTPVKGDHFMDNGLARQVLEIRVDRDLYELYEDQNHEAFSRNGASILGPLTPHQIKKITIEKLKNKIRSDKRRADFLSPGPLRRSARLCNSSLVKEVVSGMTRSNLVNKAGNSKDDVVEISSSSKDLVKKAGNNKDDVKISSSKDLVKKTGNSNDDVIWVSSSKDLVKKTGNSNVVVKISSSKGLAKKVDNSNDDVIWVSSSQDLVKKTGNSNVVVKISSNKDLAKKVEDVSVKSSKGTVVSSGSCVKKSLPARPMSSGAQKENVSSIVKKAVSTVTSQSLNNSKPCSNLQPKNVGAASSGILTRAALKNLSTNSTITGRSSTSVPTHHEVSRPIIKKTHVLPLPPHRLPLPPRPPSMTRLLPPLRLPPFMHHLSLYRQHQLPPYSYIKNYY